MGRQSLFFLQTMDEHGHVQERIAPGLSKASLYHDITTQGMMVLKLKSLDPSRSIFQRMRERLLKKHALMSKAMWGEFFLKLAILLDAGCPLLTALESLRNDESDTSTRLFLHILMYRLSQGEHFTEILTRYTDVLDPPLILMLRMGLKTGAFSKALRTVHEHIRSDLERSAQLSKALIYPLILCGMSMVLMVGFTHFLLPTMVSFLQDMGVRDMSFSTRSLLLTARMMDRYGVGLIMGLGGLCVILGVMYRTPKMGQVIQRYLLKVPFVGECLRIHWTRGWLRTFGMLYQSGIDFQTSLNEAEKSLHSTYVMHCVGAMRTQALQGVSLCEAMRHTGLFSHFTTSLCQVGLQSGKLGDHMMEAYRIEHAALNERLNTCIRLLEPGLIVVMGLLIVWIASAVIVPLYTHLNVV